MSAPHRLPAMSIFAVWLALSCSCLANAKPAAEWVDEARLIQDDFNPDEKITIEVEQDCSFVITQGNETVDFLDLQSGMGHIISICSAPGAAENPHYFTAEEFFASSALRKYQTEYGYGKAHQMLACESFSGTCCDMYVVPVVPGEYDAVDEKCDNMTFPIIVTGDESATLENPTLPAYKPLAERPAEVQSALSSSWPGWAEAATIEIVLVEDLCETESPPAQGGPGGGGEGEGSTEGEGAVEGEGSRRLLQDSAGPSKLHFMYAGGHSGVNSQLFQFATGSPGLITGSSGEGEGSAEGEGEGGAEGGAEGGLEGGAPAEAEGEQALEGEGAAPAEGEGAAPAEGEGAALTSEGEGGTGTGPAAPGGEGEGGEGEGGDDDDDDDAEVDEGEGTRRAARRLEQVDEGQDALGEGAEGFEGLEGASAPEGLAGAPEGVQEGGEGGDVFVMAVDAGEHPIELVVNKAYIIRFALYQATGSYYLTAPEFFASAVVRKFQNPFAEMKFATYPTEFEIFKDVDGAYVDLYVVPTEAGTFDITSGSLDPGSLNGAKILVVENESQLSAGSKIFATPIEAGACGDGVDIDARSSALQVQFSIKSMLIVLGILAVLIG